MSNYYSCFVTHSSKLVAVKIPEFRIVIPGIVAETRNPFNHFNPCIQPVQ